MKEIDLQIGYRVRDLREQLNYSREKFAEFIGISPDFLSNIENGKNSFTVNVLKGICKSSNINSDFILFGINNKTDQCTFLLNQMDDYQLKLAFGIINVILKENKVT